MDWAEDKYSVNQSTQKFIFDKFLFFFFLVDRLFGSNVSVPCVSAFTETSDSGDQDGAARLGPLHPAANVLGSVRSAGTVHPADFFFFSFFFIRKTTHFIN